VIFDLLTITVQFIEVLKNADVFLIGLFVKLDENHEFTEAANFGVFRNFFTCCKFVSQSKSMNFWC